MTIEIRTQRHPGILGGRPNTRVKITDFRDKHSEPAELIAPMDEDEYLERLQAFHLALLPKFEENDDETS